MSLSKYIFILLWCGSGFILKAQTINGISTDGSRRNNISTAVPFLLIMPQSRSGAMGNAGVAMDADVNAPSLNTSAMAYLPDDSYGIAVTYSPWLKRLVADMSLSYLSTYYRINERNTIGASLRYFSIGDVSFVDDNFQSLGVYNPNEFAFDVNYARSFGPEFSLGGSIRFVYSNLYAGRIGLDGQSAAGKALAADVSGLYKTNTILFGTDAIWSAGINISNIGTKMSYNLGDRSYFLPGNLKVGTAATLLGNESKLIIAFDLNKLLVPTEPIYGSDGQILKGKNPNRSVPAGIFGSFTDAPGGFSEELKEIGISAGLEFSFKDRFAFRTGYNYQNPQKGDSNYFTVGAGFKYNMVAIDLSYLVGSANTNPLANTIRFGLQTTFGSKRKL